MLRFVVRRCMLVLPSLLGLLVDHLPADPRGAVGSRRGDSGRRRDTRADRAPAPASTVSIARSGSSSSPMSARSPRSTSVRAPSRAGRSRSTSPSACRPPLMLTFCALAISVFVGVPLGVIAGLCCTMPGRTYLLRVFSVMGIAVAAFWFAIMLQLLLLDGAGLAALARRTLLHDVAAAEGHRLHGGRCADRRPLRRGGRRPAPSRPAGGDPVAGRARHHRALHAGRRARHAAAGFRLL